jgi:hypothetical protein
MKFKSLIAIVVSMSIFSSMASGGALLEDRTERPLHFHPDGRDFVVENGKEFFNRPLYGPNNGFRIDAGDKPEFSLYLPGRGGNLRLGVSTAAGTKWLNDAEKIIARYRAGSMVYEIHDAILGAGIIHLTALPVHNAEGLIVQIELTESTDAVKLIWAYGGASGERGTRDGDIGTERQPVSQYFQLQPAACAGNSFAIDGNQFTLTSKPAAIVGLAPAGAQLGIADANQWNSPVNLVDSVGKPAQLTVLVGQYDLHANAPAYLALQRISRPGDDRGELGTYLAVRQESPKESSSQLTQSGATQPTATQPAVMMNAEKLPAIFADAEKHRQSIADIVIADTPDAYINAAVAALGVAADGLWDEKQSVFMHGAVAWRSRLLGWRGPYSADELGWHDRAVRDMIYWAGRQNLSAIPDQIPPLDPSSNLSRDEPALHSNGDLSNSHYDMNLVFIDAVFRHILWTGDLEFARKNWPMIEAHLAWEKRLFRRTFGPENLPLYEAYCCIWASDDLEYSGGGAAHSSAYNYYHNLMAARLAKALGKDPSAYESEAKLIAQGMRKELWLHDRGWFAECKDFLGKQLVHASPALWTFYHTVDSQVPTPMEAWEMSRFIDTQIAHIPIHGAGVPAGGYFTLPTTNWMFYTWSINNVVMAESAHTSLAYWQANRADEAFKLFKGCVLDSMFQGLCPGNAGMCTYFDVARGESQRDFGDAVGTCSRAVVEGLFGIRPDALAGELSIVPGFPADWEHAALHHPDFDFAFTRQGMREIYAIDPKFPKPLSLRLSAAAYRDGIESVTINGNAAKWSCIADSVGTPRIEILCPAAPRFVVEIVWKGAAPFAPGGSFVVARGDQVHEHFGAARFIQVQDPEEALDHVVTEAGGLDGIASGTMGHRTVFAKLGQGDLIWWSPVSFEIRPAVEIIASRQQDANGCVFKIRNNTASPIDTGSLAGIVPSFGESKEILFYKDLQIPGTNDLNLNLNGQLPHARVINWKISGKKLAARLEPVEMKAAFNDQLTHIFEPTKYLSPRSPFCSLSMPSQGIGSWCRPTATAAIDDSGLRRAADLNQGRYILPDGIPFATPGAGGAKNIAFASQWDNYPRQIEIPLSGRASHVYLLMAGSTNWMQSRIENGQVAVNYSDGTSDVLTLENPTNWWPIEEDYLIDDYGFARPEPLPIRVDLRTGTARVLEMSSFKGIGGRINGGAATVLDFPLQPTRELKSLQVRATANEVVIGLMGATLLRP